MEAMCQERRLAGLPAVSIQWPIIAHLGYAANNEVRPQFHPEAHHDSSNHTTIL